MNVAPDLAISAAELERRLAGLDAVGTGPDGVTRLAWSPQLAAAERWFGEQAAQLGLRVQRDGAGSLWACPDTAPPWWATGSHLDSVRRGGRYDGPLGVAAAFAAAARCPSSVAVIAFADEEGARFGVPCAGSRLMNGGLDPDRARSLPDTDGTTMAEAMSTAGHDPSHLGRDDKMLSRIGTFVELHVEQGRGLVDLDAPVGVASSIRAHGRWRLDLPGEANHAGTTRLVDRDDPMLRLAAAVLAARDSAEQCAAVATIGKVHIHPGGTNAIPSLVRAWLDARGEDEQSVRRVVAAAGEAAGAEPVEESWSPEVTFGRELREHVAGLFGDAPVLATGAGHDAGVLAGAGVRAAMLFVRNPTGVSHSPAEHAETDDCLAGVEALAAVLTDLLGAETNAATTARTP
ncbi:MAG: allantoate amidohydrolase [Solirubrobacterales bacterium]|nr:allantoate amidohydrolase [Solirubrobacterales bacterium]